MKKDRDGALTHIMMNAVMVAKQHDEHIVAIYEGYAKRHPPLIARSHVANIMATHVNPWRVCDVIRTSLHAEPSPQSLLLCHLVGLGCSMNFRRHGRGREGHPAAPRPAGAAGCPGAGGCASSPIMYFGGGGLCP